MSETETYPKGSVRAQILKTDGPLTVDQFVKMDNTPGRVGVTFCGGGSRAMSAGLGELRALAQLRLKGADPKSTEPQNQPLLGLTKALSAVSGGAWLSGPFTYLPDHVSDEAYLGTYVPDPGRLVRRKTPKNRQTPVSEILSQMAEGYAGQTIGSPRFTVVGLALQAVLLKRFAKIPTHRLWQTMIGMNILKPYGLYVKGEGFRPTTTFSYDTASHKRQIVDLNPDLADYPVHLIAAGEGRIRRPFWICNTSMFVNEPEAEGQQLVPVQSNPFFTGIVSDPDSVDANQQQVGGGAVSTFAFSSQLLGIAGSSVHTQPSHLFSLTDIVGLSSVAFATALEQKIDEWREDHVPLANVLMEQDEDVEAWFEEHFESQLPKALRQLLHRPALRKFLKKSGIGVRVGLKLEAELSEAIEEISDFIPEALYWPVRQPEIKKAATLKGGLKATRFADGGNLENTGIANLLTYTDVDRVIAFINSPTPMKTVDKGVLSPADAQGKSTEIPDTRILIDSQVSVLFGYQAHKEQIGYQLYADADPEKIPDAERPFQVDQVFPSEAFPEIVRGLWAASHGLQRPAIFEQTLETVENQTFGVRGGRKVRVLWFYLDRVQDWLDLLTDEVRELLGQKGYETFPCFPTNQGLNPSQINLLAHFTSWCVADPSNRAAFQRMYET